MAAMDLKTTFGERLPPRTLPLILGFTTLVAGCTAEPKSLLVPRRGTILWNGPTERAGSACL